MSLLILCFFSSYSVGERPLPSIQPSTHQNILVVIISSLGHQENQIMEGEKIVFNFGFKMQNCGNGMTRFAKRVGTMFVKSP